MNAELFNSILSAGYNPPTHLKPSGEVTRFNVGNGKQNKDGWITVFLDGKGAVFGDWKSGSKFTWFEKSVVVENSETLAERNAAIQRTVNDQNARYDRAAIEAQQIYNNAIPCDSHSYLAKKGVAVCAALRISNDGRLIVPVFDRNEVIQSLQYIDNDGGKRFLQDGKMKGGCFVIGGLEHGKKALLSEGLATGLTCHAATRLPVIVAFNAGNLKAVFDIFKDRVDLYIAADNDLHGKGYKCALECVPPEKIIMPPSTGDFNDIGADATRELFALLVDNSNSSLFMSVSELMSMDFRSQWLIKGFVEKGGIGMVYGESGIGKSLFTLDWAYCVATGRNWHGFKVKKPSKVLYIAGEGGRGFKMRITALNQKYGAEIKGGIDFSKQSFNFLDKKSAQSIIYQVENMTEIPELIFIDTLHRNMIGDENKAEDMGQFLASIEILVKKYGCAIVIVHHSGIADKGRARGSSSIQAGMDFVFCVSKGNDFETSITCVKMKDADKPPPLKFLINKIDLPGDEWYDEDDDKQMTGVHLIYQGIDSEKEQKLCPRDELALTAVKQALDENGIDDKDDKMCVVNGSNRIVHFEQYRAYFNATCKGKNKARDFDIALKSLETRRYIGKDGCWLWIIEE